MKNTKKLLFGASATTLLAVAALTGCGGKSGGGIDEYDSQGRLILNLANVYFTSNDDKLVFDGTDRYTEFLNEKFNVKIQPSGYSYEDWDEQVSVAMKTYDIDDNIHFDLKSYNFGKTYADWASKTLIRALPTDLSRWPEFKKMIDNISNIDKLKIDGKLYGIPIANDITNINKDFSNFTYVYRRDILKAIDEEELKKDANYTPLVKENDVYTWDEFERILRAFKAKIETKYSVLVDESWGFPSITNFYKNAPHCYTVDENGKAINNFTSPEYLEGLETAKGYVSSVYYSQDQFSFNPNDAKSRYLGGKAYILYDNFNVANYTTFRKDFKNTRRDVNLEDGTASMKVKGPDGKFALEGIENWYSMVMFNRNLSDEKLYKILDILDFLLSEEGTRLAVYGEKDYDYYLDEDGDVVLSDMGWELDSNGEYPAKINGARFMRYMATLGGDTKIMDPRTSTKTNKESYEIIKNWENEMEAARDAGQLRIVKEPNHIAWMTTARKDADTFSNLKAANRTVLQYCFPAKQGGIQDIDGYKAKFNTVSWNTILDQINAKLGK